MSTHRVQTPDLIFLRQRSPWLFNDFLFRLSPYYAEWKRSLEILHGFTRSVIRERKAEFSSSLNAKEETDDPDVFVGKRKRRLAFLDLLLEAAGPNGEILSDEDIREEVDTFMFEGHDTTAANMAFTCYNLALHPEIQKRAQAEVDDIFADDPERDPTTEDLNRMKYLECCIKESLRLYPSVPMMSRTLGADVELDVS